MQVLNKRKHERLASDLPITVKLDEVVASESSYLNNISEGGLSFNSMVPLGIGTVIWLRIPVNRPVFVVLGKVACCNKMAFQYAVGVEFVSGDDALRQRIVSMVREIGIYRERAMIDEGRSLDSQQAALEWIARHASEVQARDGARG